MNDLEMQIQTLNVLNQEKEDLKRVEYESRVKMTNSINDQSSHLKNLQI